MEGLITEGAGHQGWIGACSSSDLTRDMAESFGPEVERGVPITGAAGRSGQCNGAARDVVVMRLHPGDEPQSPTGGRPRPRTRKRRRTAAPRF